MMLLSMLMSCVVCSEKSNHPFQQEQMCHIKSKLQKHWKRRSCCGTSLMPRGLLHQWKGFCVTVYFVNQRTIGSHDGKNTFLLNVDWQLIVPFFGPNVLSKHRYLYILTSECRYVFPARLSIHPLRRFSSHASQCIYYSTHAIVLKSSLPACSERDMFREVFLSSTFCLTLNSLFIH